jgi:hypothetical protein
MFIAEVEGEPRQPVLERGSPRKLPSREKARRNAFLGGVRHPPAVEAAPGDAEDPLLVAAHELGEGVASPRRAA